MAAQLARRRWLASAAAWSLAPRAARAGEAPSAAALAIGAAWRGPREIDPQQAGVLEIDWARRDIRLRWSLTLPSRAHGLLAESDGSLVVCAMRPGRWLLRCDAQGRPLQRVAVDEERGDQRLDGHAAASADGAWLYTTQSDAQGRGFVAVRERESLRKVDEWPTHGTDPHQLLLDDNGDLMLANGGIARTPDGRKRDLDRMASSLVRLDGRNGALRGQWTLSDPRLSLRHLAWGRPAADGAPRLLGVALQAEHDDTAQRASAPMLALWDGRALRAVAASSAGGGYAGDIASAGQGGFALSNHKVRRAFAWWPQQPDAFATFAELDEPYAIASPERGSDAGAIVMACGAGVARWHPTQGAAMLRWPQAMAVDNHWVAMP